MKTLAQHINIEPRWKTYLTGTAFLLPALILWEIVSIKCVPILANIWQKSEAHHGSASGFWSFAMFFVRHGFVILLAIILMLALFELFGRAGAHYRRRVVGGLVWLLNLIVICGLAALFTVTLILFPSLPK